MGDDGMFDLRVPREESQRGLGTFFGWGGGDRVVVRGFFLVKTYRRRRMVPLAALKRRWMAVSFTGVIFHDLGVMAFWASGGWVR